MASSIQSKLSRYVEKHKNMTQIQEKSVNRNRYRNERGDGIISKGFKTAIRGDKITLKKKKSVLLKNAGKEGRRKKELMTQIEKQAAVW